MVAALVDQVAHDRADRLRAEAAAVESGIEEQVDARVPVLGLELLAELDQSGDRAVHLDHQTGRAGVVGQRKALVGLVPPARDLAASRRIRSSSAASAAASGRRIIRRK